MAKQVINNGDSGLSARTKINENFSELYGRLVAKKLVRRITLEQDVYQISITEDMNGDPFHLNNFRLMYEGRHIFEIGAGSTTAYMTYNGIAISTPGWVLNASTGLYEPNLYTYQSGSYFGRQVVSVGDRYSWFALEQQLLNGKYIGYMYMAYSQISEPTTSNGPTSVIRPCGLMTPTPVQPLYEIELFARTLNSKFAKGSVVELWEV